STKQVTTLSGNGQMGFYPNDRDWDKPVLPNSPWDVLFSGDDLFVADAGNHQVLRFDFEKKQLFRFAGSGREGIADGDLHAATFSQPSGIASDGHRLYVADPESSAIREIDLKNRRVFTLLGKGLFSFGDKDGPVSSALLQHCTSVAYNAGEIFIADTYNGKAKALNIHQATIRTLVSGLDEPGGICISGDHLWITDTNNNELVVYDLNSHETKRIRFF
ncbi:MAG TPA: hypothetical protein VGC95_08240, partial [Chitinophagaceae bacterium]